MNSWAVLLLASLSAFFAYVLPGERVITEMARIRKAAPPLRVEAQLAGIVQDWPEQLLFEIHPDFGIRVTDSHQGRWLILGDRLAAGPAERRPIWIPPLDALSRKSEDHLAQLLRRRGIDPSRNELGRFQEADCFVLGGRNGRAQLWLDKDRFEVQRLVLRDGSEVHFEGYKLWGEVRFPSLIRVLDDHGEIAQLTISALRQAPGLKKEDFSLHWAGPGGRPLQD